MNRADIEALLRSHAVHENGVSTEVSTRKRSLSLKFTRDSDPEDFAVVWTSGDLSELAVEGGFSAFHVDEDPTDGEFAEIIKRYVKAALAYLEGRKRTVRSPVLHLPTVVIDTDDGPLDLRLSVTGAVKDLFRRQSR